MSGLRSLPRTFSRVRRGDGVGVIYQYIQTIIGFSFPIPLTSPKNGSPSAIGLFPFGVKRRTGSPGGDTLVPQTEVF